jgi:diguanylate cyclase (GGDEF)-like protein
MTAVRSLGDEAFAAETIGGRRRAITLLTPSKPTYTVAPAPEDSDERSLDLLIGSIADILNSQVALYCQLDGKGQPPEVICSWGLGPLHEWLARPLEGGFVGRALGAQRAALEPLHPDYDAGLLAATNGTQLTHAAAAPVRPATGTVGTLIAGFSAPPADLALTLGATESCAAMLALGAHHLGALDALLRTARLDSLTGCLDYASSRHELEREINRSTRADLDLALCFIDLDNFKRVNNERGHLRGNEVLTEVAHVLRSSIRSCDTIGRFGGDEFIAILPETTVAGAIQVAKHLRSIIATTSISSARQPLTASVGVTQWTRGTTAEQLLARADEALLLAKARGAGIAQSETRAPLTGA